MCILFGTLGIQVLLLQGAMYLYFVMSLHRLTEQCNIHTVVGRVLEPLDQLLTDTMQQTESIVKAPVCNYISYVYPKPTPICIKRIAVYQTYIVCYNDW